MNWPILLKYHLIAQMSVPPKLTAQFELFQTVFCQQKIPLLCHFLTKKWYFYNS